MPKLKPYPKYKPSNIQWLGDIPGHWQVLPNRAVFDQVNERGHPEEEMLSVTIKEGIIRQQDLLEDSSKKDASRLDKSNYKLVLQGDIAYNKMRAWQGAIGMSRYRGIVSPAYIVQRPRSIANPTYLHNLLRTPLFQKEAERWSYGIVSDMWSLRPEHFKVIYIPLPPLDEQRAIARYLDHITSRIDTYTSNKRKLVDLLKEYRQALIQQTVTRGLDPNVKLKPSGIQWLGDIPQHWEVRRLKTCVQDVVQSSNGVAEGDLCLALEHVESWTGKYKEAGPDESLDSQTKRFMPNDVLFGKLRPYLAKVARPNRTGICVGEFLVLRTYPESMTPNYLEQLIRSKPVIDAINSSTFGAKMPRTDWKFIGNMKQPLPPLAEQRAIADYLDHKTAKIDTAIDLAQREIELLHEYRTRLIADVVTGQLDVRDQNVPATPA